MQIPALSSPIQTGLNVNPRGADGSQRIATDAVNEGQSDNSVQATGSTGSSQATQPVEETTPELAVAQDQAALTTTVVTATDEVLGTSLGLNIDTTA